MNGEVLYRVWKMLCAVAQGDGTSWGQGQFLVLGVGRYFLWALELGLSKDIAHTLSFS